MHNKNYLTNYNLSFLQGNKNPIGLGIQYFILGWILILQKSLLPFTLGPILINIFLIFSLSWLFYTYSNNWIAHLPSWLDWMSYLFIPLAIFIILIIFYFMFTAIANFIAAPFNSLLAEKIEFQLTGNGLENTTILGLLKDLPRMLAREGRKLFYILPRLLILFLLGFIPVLGQLVVPVIMFFFSAWLVSIQYCDYPFDNNKISFIKMRKSLVEKKIMVFTFGVLVSLFTVLPIINLFVMPAAVAGATAMWVNEYKKINVV